eukprot:148320-Pleurochrysis_carterae.AAC.1
MHLPFPGVTRPHLYNWKGAWKFYGGAAPKKSTKRLTLRIPFPHLSPAGQEPPSEKLHRLPPKSFSPASLRPFVRAVWQTQAVHTAEQ